MSDKVQVLTLKDTLDDLTARINSFLSSYTSSPIFWIVITIILLLIGCWGIRYFGKK